LGLILLALVLAVGVIGGAIWIEGRHPSDEEARALSPRVQRVVTRPIAATVGRQVDRCVRRAAQAPYLHSELSRREAIARFLDGSLDLSKRRLLAFRLAREASPDCVAALRSVLGSAPAADRAYMARRIGLAGNPKLNGLLRELLEDPDERVVLAVVEALPVLDTPAACAGLAALLRDPGRSPAVRAAAATGLGSIGGDGAASALCAALEAESDPEVTAAVLGALGKLPFARVSGVITQYIEAPETDADLRVAAVEALAGSSTAAVPFLLGLAATAEVEDVRAAAAWAVSVHEAVDGLAPVLVELAQQEPSEDVRRRLYEALLPQHGTPVERLLPLVQSEQDTAARVAGCNAVGAAVAQQPLAGAAAVFDRDLVPDLAAIAAGGDSANLRMRAVFALRRAHTAAAQAALATIAAQASPPIAAAARNGLWAASP